MEYSFDSNPKVVYTNTTIFKGDNALGKWENGVLIIYDSKVKYYFKNGDWYIETEMTEEPMFCGKGAVPVLQIENLQIIDEQLFGSILYIPPIENYVEQ